MLPSCSGCRTRWCRRASSTIEPSTRWGGGQRTLQTGRGWSGTSTHACGSSAACQVVHQQLIHRFPAILLLLQYYYPFIKGFK